MAKYSSYLIEVPDLDEALQQVNEKGSKLMGVTYISDSQQLLLIVEEQRSILQSMKGKQAEVEEGVR